MSDEPTARESCSRNLYSALGFVMVCILVYLAFMSNTTTEYRQVGRSGKLVAPAQQCPTLPPMPNNDAAAADGKSNPSARIQESLSQPVQPPPLSTNQTS